MVERRILSAAAAARIRPRLEIDAMAIRWMASYARKNYWRVAAWISLDDLIQEGYFTWYRLVQGEMRHGPNIKPSKKLERQPAYNIPEHRRHEQEALRQIYGCEALSYAVETETPRRSAIAKYALITDRLQMMGLFMRTFEQHITDMSNHKTRLPIIAESDIAAIDGTFDVTNISEEAAAIPAKIGRGPEDRDLAKVAKSLSAGGAQIMATAGSAPDAVKKALGNIAKGRCVPSNVRIVQKHAAALGLSDVLRKPEPRDLSEAAELQRWLQVKPKHKYRIERAHAKRRRRPFPSSYYAWWTAQWGHVVGRSRQPA